jgi:uncharacterized membrane protein
VVGIGWLFVAIGALLASLSVPLALGKVPPNRFYGFRTPRTVSDPELWVPVNQMAGRALVPMGMAMAAVGLAVVFGLMTAEAASLAVLPITLVPLMWTMWKASVMAAELDGHLPTTERESPRAEVPEERQAPPSRRHQAGQVRQSE